jgi:hypothetical protein
MTDWLIWNQLVLFAVEEEDSAFSMSFFLSLLMPLFRVEVANEA